MAKRRPGDPPRFMMICDTFANFFVLNLLFALCSIPVITIGASINALNTMMIKTFQERDGKIIKEFFAEFKKGFFKSTCIWLVYIIAALLMYTEFLFLKQGSDTVRVIILTLLGFQGIFVASTFPYVFWLNARYENTVKMMFINSFLLFFKRMWTWARMVIIWAGPIALMVTFRTILIKFWIVWVLILVSFLTYMCCMLMMREFDRLEKAAAEAEELKKEEAKKAEAEKINTSKDNIENSDTSSTSNVKRKSLRERATISKDI